MTIVTESLNEVCKRMTLDEFKQKCIQHVRHQNYMDLTESWERHIIHKEFESHISKADGLSSYYGNIYFANELFKSDEGFSIKIYLFYYHEHYMDDDSASFSCEDGELYKESITAISKLFNCFIENKNHYFGCTLDDYHKAESSCPARI